VVGGDEITWANSDLRAYLNNEFYDTLSSETKARIIETQVVTNDNPEYGTPGGADTIDKIFLLSIEEAEAYFSDDITRAAYAYHQSTRAGSPWYDGRWWLRSPGYVSSGGLGVGFTYIAYHVAYVSGEEGIINVMGTGAHDYTNDGVLTYNSGVRPAFWINL
jgi:hypothetical protein